MRIIIVFAFLFYSLTGYSQDIYGRMEIFPTAESLVKGGIVFDSVRYSKNYGMYDGCGNLAFRTADGKTHFFEVDSVWGYKYGNDLYRNGWVWGLYDWPKVDTIGNIIFYKGLRDNYFSKNLDSRIIGYSLKKLKKEYKENPIFIRSLAKEFETPENNKNDIYKYDKVLKIYNSCITDSVTRQVIIAKHNQEINQTVDKVAIPDTPTTHSIITNSFYYSNILYGGTFNLYKYRKKSFYDWIFATLISGEILYFKTSTNNNANYIPVNIYCEQIGVSTFRKLYNNLYLNGSISLPIGLQTIKTHEYTNRNVDSNFFVGLSSSQGLYYISKKKWGLSFGISIFERITTSEIYKQDIGIKIEMGIKI